MSAKLNYLQLCQDVRQKKTGMVRHTGSIYKVSSDQPTRRSLSIFSSLF